jgi:hypothetical protein
VSTIYGLLDRLAERYSEREQKLSAMRAREEYFDRAGKVFDDDGELFESRMASFLEWYVLERPLSDGKPPVIQAIEQGAALPAEERRALAALATSHRSLFQLHAIADRVLDLEDVIGGARFFVQERRSTVGISPGDLFEARLIWDGDQAPGAAEGPESGRRSTVAGEARPRSPGTVIFGRTFLFHPPDAREVVLDWVERAVAERKPPVEILFHLSRQYVRWHRLGHIGAAKVYRDA